MLAHVYKSLKRPIPTSTSPRARRFRRLPEPLRANWGRCGSCSTSSSPWAQAGAAGPRRGAGNLAARGFHLQFPPTMATRWSRTGAPMPERSGTLRRSPSAPGAAGDRRERGLISACIVVRGRRLAGACSRAGARIRAANGRSHRCVRAGARWAVAVALVAGLRWRGRWRACWAVGLADELGLSAVVRPRHWSAVVRLDGVAPGRDRHARRPAWRSRAERSGGRVGVARRRWRWCWPGGGAAMARRCRPTPCAGSRWPCALLGPAARCVDAAPVVETRLDAREAPRPRSMIPMADAEIGSKRWRRSTSCAPDLAPELYAAARRPGRTRASGTARRRRRCARDAAGGRSRPARLPVLAAVLPTCACCAP